jgi:hypothetical protein
LGCSALFALLAAAGAHAGTYTIGDCPDAFNRATVAGPWQFFGPTAGATIKTECAGEIGQPIFFAIPELPTTPMGFRASTIGTDDTILGARMWWRAFGSPSGEVEAEMQASYGPEEYSAISQWDGSGTLVEQMATPEELSFPASYGTNTIVFAEHCLTAGTCQMSESFGVGIEIFGAELTLNDEAPPTVTLRGVEHESGGAISGPVKVAFTASDPTAGVEKAELLVDGAAVATHDYRSSCTFAQLQACPGSIADQLEFAGASLPEGSHQLVVRVTDAPGNSAVTPAQPLTTSHSAPVPHVPNGVPCPTPSIALTANGRTGQATIPYGHGATVEGRLGCGVTAIPGASIGLGITTLPGTPAAPSAPIQTSAHGTFRYQLAPGPSRKLTFSYVAYSNEPAPTTQAAMQINVRPKMTLHIRPRRTHDGGTIKWSGKIEGGPYPLDGMPVLVQVKEGKRWQTFEELEVHNGKIAYEYTFLRTRRPTTYTFRVALPRGGDVGYPYAPAASTPVKVHVR